MITTHLAQFWWENRLDVRLSALKHTEFYRWLKEALLTSAGGVGRICVCAVITVSTGANTGCSRAGTAVGWAGQAQTVPLFGLEGARAARWWQKRERWRKHDQQLKKQQQTNWFYHYYHIRKCLTLEWKHKIYFCQSMPWACSSTHF